MENFEYEEILIPFPKQEPCIRSPFRERAKFYDAKKQQNESVTDYYTKLLNLSIGCEFNENFNERALCDKFITGFASGFIFEHLCNQNKDITFGDALNLALKYESDLQNDTDEICTKSDRVTDPTIKEEVSVSFIKMTIVKLVYYYRTWK